MTKDYDLRTTALTLVNLLVEEQQATRAVTFTCNELSDERDELQAKLAKAEERNAHLQSEFHRVDKEHAQLTVQLQQARDAGGLTHDRKSELTVKESLFDYIIRHPTTFRQVVDTIQTSTATSESGDQTKIGLIRWVRDQTSLGLKEARNLVYHIKAWPLP